MLYIVIPVYNRISFTRNCLNSLKRQTFKDFKVIVVDDGSTDGTDEMLAREFPEVRCLTGDGNLYWTASTNLGIEYALEEGATKIMTLNNDVIAKEDFVSNMMLWAQKKPDALLGALAFDAETQLPSYGGEVINWITASSQNLLDYYNTNSKLTGIHEVTHFPGRGLLIPVSVFKKIGLFDGHNFPQYAADYDFTHRAIKAGYPVYCNYDAQIYIYPEESGSQKVRNSKSLNNYYYYLFGLKSAGNLVKFTKYAFKNCPPVYLPMFLVLGIARRIGGYLRDWANEFLKTFSARSFYRG